MCEITQALACDIDYSTTGRKSLDNYMSRMKEETAPYYDEAHTTIMLMRKGYLKSTKSAL